MTFLLPLNAEVWLKDRSQDLANQRRTKPFRPARVIYPIPPGGFQVGDEVEITSEPGFSNTGPDRDVPWEYQWGRIGDRGRVTRLRVDGGVCVEGTDTRGCETFIGTHCLSLARPAVREPTPAPTPPVAPAPAPPTPPTHGLQAGDEVEITSEPGYPRAGRYGGSGWEPQWGQVGQRGRVVELVGADGVRLSGLCGYNILIGTHCLERVHVPMPAMPGSETVLRTTAATTIPGGHSTATFSGAAAHDPLFRGSTTTAAFVNPPYRAERYELRAGAWPEAYHMADYAALEQRVLNSYADSIADRLRDYGREAGIDFRSYYHFTTRPRTRDGG